MLKKLLRYLQFLIILLNVVSVHAEGVVIPYEENPNVIIDGVISNMEYLESFNDSITNMSVYWLHNGTDLFIGLVSQGSGWMAIGLGSSGVEMDGSNILIGFISEMGNVSLIDEIGVGRNHYPDTSRGGQNDVKIVNGSKLNNTVLEFIFPLSSGDQLDNDFAMNRTYGFFLAYHESNVDTNVFHTKFSETFDIFIEPSPGFVRPTPNYGGILFYITGGLLALIFILFIYRWINKPKIYRWSEMNHG
jgi:hypothetical protein